MDDRPIGVFDSGIGGLTVLGGLRSSLPGENFVYLGDTARVPYGSKSDETVRRYSLEIGSFLSGYGIKLLVVACNTASATALDELKERLDVPVIGVIEPGARAAVEATNSRMVGVIGTEGTIRSGAYFDAIKASNDRVVVFPKACPLFVSLAEEGWTNHEATRLIAEEYLKELKDHSIDTLLLGCTHYPLLTETIASVMGPEVTLIDSATSTASTVKEVLTREGLLKTDNAGNDSGDDNDARESRFFTTDSPERFERVGSNFIEGPIKAELVTVGGS